MDSTNTAPGPFLSVSAVRRDGGLERLARQAPRCSAIGLALGALLAGCARETPERSWSLMAVADLGVLESSRPALEATELGDRWPDETQHVLARDAPRIPFALRLDDTARTCIALLGGERFELPVPRSASRRHLQLHAAAGGGTSLRVAFEWIGPNRNDSSRGGSGPTPPLLLAEHELSGTSPGWTALQVELPSSRSRGRSANAVGRLRIRVDDQPGDRDAWVALATLRAIPDPVRGVGPDLVVVCDERLTQSPPPTATDPGEPAGIRIEDCWAASPLPGPAFVSLLTGVEPTVHGRPGGGSGAGVGATGAPATDARTAAGTVGLPPTLTTLLRDAGYRTTLIAERGTVAAAQPLDLGFESVEVVEIGRGLAALRDRLADPGPGSETTESQALCLVRAPGAAALDLEAELPRLDRSQGAHRTRLTVHTALGVGERPFAGRSFDHEHIRVPLSLSGLGLELGPDPTPRSHLDLLPTLVRLLDLPSPPITSGDSIVAAGAAGWRLSEPTSTLRWAEIPGITYLVESDPRRTAWTPGSTPALASFVDDRPVESPDGFESILSDRLHALEELGASLYRGGD